MNAIKSTVAAVVWGLAKAVFAQAADSDEAPERSTVQTSKSDIAPGDDVVAELLAGEQEGSRHAHEKMRRGLQFDRYIFPDIYSAYHAGAVGELTASAGFSSTVSSAASAAFIQQQTGIDARSMLSAERWLKNEGGLAQTVAVGHAWGDIRFEGTAFTTGDDGRPPVRRDFRRIDSRSTRLSFAPAANWVVRLSRGTVSGLDHLVAGDEIRRTAVSATYRRPVKDGDWEATFAWGRNSRKFRESTVGYLVETAYRFDGVHSVFGRVEQVGSDEIARENESLQRQLFMMNKLTFGYSQGIRLSPTLYLDSGFYATRYFVPSSMAPSYGSGPTAYMMFVRVKLQ